MRFIIDNGMRSGIKDTEARASTVTLYLDVKKFSGELGLASTKEIMVIIVTPSGDILAQVLGRYSEQGAAEIERALHEAGNPERSGTN